MTTAGRGAVQARPRNPALVGRTHEMEVFGACLGRALAGEPQLVLVQGEPGIGKTRLLSEFAAAAEARGAAVSLGRCHEDLRLPFLPFADSLFTMLQGVPDWDPGALKRIRGSQAGESEEALASERLDFFLAVSRSVTRLAMARPLVICLDDLQWADQASIDLTAHIVFAVADAARRGRVPLLGLVAHRRPEAGTPVSRAVGRFQREGLCTRLDLTRLGLLEVDALVRSAGLVRPTPDVVERIYSISQGNPFMVIELTNSYRKGGPDSGGRAGSAARAEPGLPEELTGPTLMRLREVSEEGQQVLALAAAMGYRISVPTLAAVSGLGEDGLLDLLEQAEEQRLVVADGDGYQFEHPLVRTAILRRQSPPRRRRLHALIAEKLEELWAGALDEHATEIAHHLIGAGAAGKRRSLVEYARQAGASARTAMSWTEAGRFYEAALSAEHAGLSMEERSDLTYWCGFVLHRAGDLSAAIARYDEAIALFQAGGDEGRLADTLIEKLNAQLQPGPGTLVDTRPLETLLDGLDDPSLEARACAQLSSAYLFTENLDQAEDCARRALAAAADRASDRPWAMYANLTLGRLAYRRLHLKASWGFYDEALKLARLIADRRQQSAIIQRAPAVLLALGRVDEAEALAREGLDFGRETGTYGGAALSAAVLAFVATLRGDFAGAESHAQESLLLYNRSGYQWALPLVMSAFAAARYARGATAEASDALSIVPAAGGGAHRMRRLIAAYSALVSDTATPPPEQAPPTFRADMDYLWNFCAAIETGAICGDPAPPREAYDGLKAAADEGLVFPEGTPFLIQRILGLLAAASGLAAEAESHFQAALRTANAIGARVELARTYLDYGRLLSEAGTARHQDAAGLLENALPIIGDLGLRPMRRMAEALARDLRVEIGAEEPAEPNQPSYFEEAVLEQSRQGRSEQAIAAGLGISLETVRAILAKQPRRPPTEPAGEPAARPVERRQTTAVILFTDVVDSVGLTERLGDQAMHQLVQRLHDALRSAITGRDGTIMPGVLLGDGLLATFASASQALSAAVEIRRAAEELDVKLHIGLHAGDVIWDGHTISGGAVNIASRVRDACPPGEVLASNTVRDLALTATGVVFHDLGLHSLRGVAEQRRLFAVRQEVPKARAYPDRLSAREVEVLQLVAEGKSNQEIADALVLSVNTVVRHVSNIYVKTGAANRAEATAYAHRQHLAN